MYNEKSKLHLKEICEFQQWNGLKPIIKPLYMKKLAQFIFITAIFFLVYYLLGYSLSENYLTIAVIIVSGLLGGLIIRLFTGYVIPTKLLFQIRFIIYGIGLGLMMGLMLFITNAIKIQSFDSKDFIRWLIISILVGVVIYGGIFYKKFRNLKKKTNGSTDAKNTVSDFALYIDSDDSKIRGRLLLSEGKLAFYSSENGDCLFEMSLLDINPIITKAKYWHIPDGFMLINRMYSINISFPYYWLKIIDNERNKMIVPPQD